MTQEEKYTRAFEAITYAIAREDAKREAAAMEANISLDEIGDKIKSKAQAVKSKAKRKVNKMKASAKNTASGFKNFAALKLMEVDFDREIAKEMIARDLKAKKQNNEKKIKNK